MCSISFSTNIKAIFESFLYTPGARGSIIVWGTRLQAGRSLVRVPDEVIFSIYLILPAVLWACVRLNLWQKLVSGSFLGVKSGRRVGLTTLPRSVSRISENVEASISRNTKGLHGLYRDNFYFLRIYTANVIHRRWFWLMKFTLEALEGTAAPKVGIPGLSHIPIVKSRMALGPEP
jgi:hypothetical protein